MDSKEISAKSMEENSKDGKTVAILAYITIIGLIIAFVLNTEKKNTITLFHIKQSLGIALTGLILGLIGLIPIIGWIVNIFGFFILFYMWIMGIKNAIDEKKKAVPILGETYLKWFERFK